MSLEQSAPELPKGDKERVEKMRSAAMEVLPRIEAAKSLRELYDILDSIKGWSEEIDAAKGTKDQIADPRTDEEQLRARLKNVANPAVGNVSWASQVGTYELAEAVKKKGEELGLFAS
jgi:hypothetical protein